MVVNHVVVGTGGSGSKYLKRNFPVEEGLILGSTKIEGEEQLLQAQGLP